MAVVLLCALQNFLFQFIFVKMRDEVPLSCSWDKVGIEGLSSQLNPEELEGYALLIQVIG